MRTKLLGCLTIALAAAFALPGAPPPDPVLPPAPPAAKLEPPAADKIEPPARDAVRERVLLAVVEAGNPSPEFMQNLGKIWSSDQPTLDAVVASAALRYPDVKLWLEGLQIDTWKAYAPPALLNDKKIDGFLRSNLAVYLGRELVRARMIDEALTVLESAQPADVVDPATYYFHLAACRHHLLKKPEALDAIDALERVKGAPDRYLGLASLMRGALEPLQADKLDGVAHDMRDIRRRLELGRTDKKVRDIEITVVNRLDKMIKELEEKQKSGSGGGKQSSSPMPDSRRAGGTGEGKVDNKTFKSKDGWGNLPEKDRQKALQEIGRDFPTHYRDAVEEYFKKLAASKSRR